MHHFTGDALRCDCGLDTRPANTLYRDGDLPYRADFET